jgi:hypothetical protein
MLEGIPKAKDRLQTLMDCDDTPPIFTLNLRVDYQIKRMCGSFDHVLRKYKDFLVGLEKGGDELAWHPHFWFYDEDNGVWYQNLADVDWQVAMLKEAYAAYQDVFPGRARSVRMGWTYHNNRTLAALDKLGVEVETSGLPGLKILPRASRGRMANFYDWSITPTKPYNPSVADYRREAKEGEESLSILETPNYVAGSFFWGILSGVVLARKMKDVRQVGYAFMRPAYYSSISGKPALFKPLLSQMKKDLRRSGMILYITLFHADELIENIHPVYSLENMVTNLSSIHKLAPNMRARVKYIRACDVKEYIKV